MNFLEERWPSLAAFSDENPGDEFGYVTMAEISFAYSKLGNQERADEALLFVDNRINSLADQGVNNFLFSANRGFHYAMLGDVDTAFEYLQAATNGGWAYIGGRLEEIPGLENLIDDPRFAEIESRMLATMNKDRAVIGLPPIDVDYQVTP